MRELQEIIDAIDAARVGTPLAHFYADRGALLQRMGSRRSLFSEVNRADAPLTGYAHHWGGRTELQFNIGFEDRPDQKYFRFGAAFSIERTRELQEPVAVLEPLVRRFNTVLLQYPELGGLQMWNVDKRVKDKDDRRSAVGKLHEIPDDWIHEGSFIFFGVSVPVGTGDLSDELARDAVTLLNTIYPLYLSVMDRRPFERRIARISWNTAMWQRPSGQRQPHQRHSEPVWSLDEWLFDLSMQVDGFKYGHVKALANSALPTGRLGLLLYTHDEQTGQHYWAGAIDHVERVSDIDAALVVRTYREQGWTDVMVNQVAAMGGHTSGLRVDGPRLTMRFRPQALHVFDPPVPIPADLVQDGGLDQLLAMPPALPVPAGRADVARALREADIVATEAQRSGYYASGAAELLQAQWQIQLKGTLAADLPEGVFARVETQVDGHRIDVVLEESGRLTFIELKPRGTVRQVIREALGQVMEYAYWPSEKRCHALLLVGSGAAGAADLAYLGTLRERFGIPVHYLQYSEGRILGVADWYRNLPA